MNLPASVRRVRAVHVVPRWAWRPPRKTGGRVSSLPINTLSQLAEVVDSSTVERRNTAYVIGHDSTKPFAYYSWSEYLQQNFSAIPRITTYHHFCVSKRFPSSVFVRQLADSDEVEIKIAEVGCNLSKNALPTILTPAGLSKERQVYLYEQIRPFCDAE